MILHRVGRGLLLLLLCVLLLSGLVLGLVGCLYYIGCLQPVRYEGPYRGKVVDADTGAPIAGAAVLGVWYREYLTVAGGVGRYYDAREVLTDANGDFTIQGQGLLLLSNVIPGSTVIFKAGYEYFEFSSLAWEDLKEGRPHAEIRWEGKKALIPLKKLTLEERKKRLIGLAGSFPQKKQKLLIRELNKESIELGHRNLYEEPE